MCVYRHVRKRVQICAETCGKLDWVGCACPGLPFLWRARMRLHTVYGVRHGGESIGREASLSCLKTSYDSFGNRLSLNDTNPNPYQAWCACTLLYVPTRPRRGATHMLTAPSAEHRPC